MVAYCTLVWPRRESDDCHRVHYTEITDTYPTHTHWDSEEFGGSGETYYFAWHHFNPEPDHWFDGDQWISFDGTTYWYIDRCEFESTPAKCPTPAVPPLHGPPPPTQLYWKYRGYPAFEASDEARRAAGWVI